MNRSYSAASRWTRTNHCHITENGLRFDALFPPVQVSLCDYRPYVLKLCLRDRRVVSWVRTYRTQGTARKYQCCYLLNINDSVTKPPTHDLEPGQQLVAPGCRLSVIIIPGDQLRVDILHPLRLAFLPRSKFHFTMGTNCRTTRLYIPHTLVDGCRIAGDLEQVEPDKPTQGRKVALVRMPHICQTYMH